MIETIGVTKIFDRVTAVNKVSLTIKDGEVFGLVGTNGAGKSTLMRMICGVYAPDGGEVLVDGTPVYDSPEIKEQVFFIPDEPYFFPNASAEDMRDYYRGIYRHFSSAGFDRMIRDFGLNPQRRISHYSKGMKKQLSVLLGISAGTKYLLCDETFDGLDPVMRQGVKSLFASNMSERGLTPVISSHNLRELEDICDHVGLLHKGGVLLSENIENMKLNTSKVQCVFSSEAEEQEILKELDVLTHEKRGRLHTITLKGGREETEAKFRSACPVFFEILPLTLEEVFISETEVAGYDVKKFILD